MYMYRIYACTYLIVDWSTEDYFHMDMQKYALVPVEGNMEARVHMSLPAATIPTTQPNPFSSIVAV